MCDLLILCDSYHFGRLFSTLQMHIFFFYFLLLLLLCFFLLMFCFRFVFCLCITQNCNYGNSDFDNQSISRMNSNRSADENVVPDVQTKPNQTVGRKVQKLSRAQGEQIQSSRLLIRAKREPSSRRKKWKNFSTSKSSTFPSWIAFSRILKQRFTHSSKIARTWPKERNSLRTLLPRWKKSVRMRSSVNMCTP